MLLPAVCTVLTAIQTFPLEDLHPTAFGEASKKYPVIVSAHISSKLGWNLHVEPLRNRERANIRTVGLTKRPAVKPARSGRFSYQEDPAWKMLLADTNRFVDAINKQLKPTNSPNGVMSKPKNRTADMALELAVINGLANASDVSPPKKRVHTPTVTPPCENGTSRSVVEGSGVRVVPEDTVALARGPGRAIPSASKRFELNTSPLASDDGSANALASRVPLNQSRLYGYKVLAPEPSVESKSAGINTFSAQSSSVTAATSLKRRRLLRGRPTTIKPTATTRFSEFPGATRSSETRTTRDPTHRVDAAIERDEGAIVRQGSSNSSKPRRLRRRKKRPKLNLFQPKRRKPAADVQTRGRKCRTVGLRRRTCEPDQRRPDDHMTDSSVVRPRVYGLDPVVGSKEREQQTRQPAAKRTRQVHQPPEERAIHESQEDYYDYSPEYHDQGDYYHRDSYESPEDVSDEDSQELDRRESNLASPGVTPEKGDLPKIVANSTLEKAAAANDVGAAEHESTAGTNRLNYGDASKDAVDPANQSASSRALNNTVEGFTLLIEDDGELASVGLRRDAQNSTNVEQGPRRDRDKKIMLPPIDSTPAAASELAAMSGAQLIRDADTMHEGAHGTSSHRREDTRSSKFFSFAEIPAHGQHRFRYRKGNDQHFTGRLELADGPHVKSVVVWADRRGGHGKHIWDYNHKD